MPFNEQITKLVEKVRHCAAAGRSPAHNAQAHERRIRHSRFLFWHLGDIFVVIFFGGLNPHKGRGYGPGVSSN
jgi:hypothetical protein